MSNDSSFVTASYIGFGIVFVAGLSALTWYTATSKDKVANTSASQNKIDIISESMQTTLGPNWPYVLLMFSVMFVILFYFLYSLGQKDPLIINFSDQGEKRFNFLFFIFIAIFTVIMIILAIRTYLNYRTKQKDPNVPNYVPTQEQDKKNMQIIEIIGLVLFIIVGIVILIRMVKSGKKKTSK